jgi:hypothetical protein
MLAGSRIYRGESMGAFAVRMTIDKRPIKRAKLQIHGMSLLKNDGNLYPASPGRQGLDTVHRIFRQIRARNPNRQQTSCYKTNFCVDVGHP